MTIAPFSADPGDGSNYLDTYSDHPDPEDGDYPVAIPAVTYDAGVAATGFVQPAKTRDTQGLEFNQEVWGEEVQIGLVAYVPGDQAVGEKDKVTVSSVDYYAASVRPHEEGSTVIHRKVLLTQRVPTAS